MILPRGTRDNANVKIEKLGGPRRSEFETGDLKLASFLYCRHFPFLDIKPGGDGGKICVFADTSELRYALVDYANDGIVPVRTFCMTLTDLQAMEL